MPVFNLGHKGRGRAWLVTARVADPWLAWLAWLLAGLALGSLRYQPIQWACQDCQTSLHQAAAAALPSLDPLNERHRVGTKTKTDVLRKLRSRYAIPFTVYRRKNERDMTNNNQPVLYETWFYPSADATQGPKLHSDCYTVQYSATKAARVVVTCGGDKRWRRFCVPTDFDTSLLSLFSRSHSH